MDAGCVMARENEGNINKRRFWRSFKKNIIFIKRIKEDCHK